MPTKLTRWAGNILLLLVSVIVPLIAFEYYLEWDNRRPDVRQYLSDVTLNGTSYLLLEGPEAIHQPNGAVLIAGDSFTAGYACADNSNYPSAFSRAAKRHGSGVHAVNLGVAGTAPLSYAVRIRDYLAEKRAAAGVILTLYANDVEIDCLACRQLHDWARVGRLTPADLDHLKQLCAPCISAGSQRVSGEVAGRITGARRLNWWLADRSLTYNVVREAAAKVLYAFGILNVDWGRAAYPRRWRDIDGVHFKYIQSSIELAKQQADTLGIPTMVVLYPDPMNITAENEYVRVYDDVSKAISSRTSVPTFNGYAAFIDNPDAERNMPFSLTDTHPSCRMHGIFGDWVYAKWMSVANAPHQ